MAANDIERFEIDSYGEVKLVTHKNGHRTEHIYYSVPKAIIKKFINASKAPTITDFDDWLKAHNNKHNSGDLPISESSNFWSSE
jgi:hypothetical protein